MPCGGAVSEAHTHLPWMVLLFQETIYRPPERYYITTLTILGLHVRAKRSGPGSYRFPQG